MIPLIIAKTIPTPKQPIASFHNISHLSLSSNLHPLPPNVYIPLMKLAIVDNKSAMAEANKHAAEIILYTSSLFSILLFILNLDRNCN